MSDQQGWDSGVIDAGPATGGTSLMLEQDDREVLAPDARSVTVRLRDTGELPFLQPRPGTIGVESGAGWMDRLSAVGRRPGSIVISAVIAGLIFAAFMTQAGQDGPSTSDVMSAQTSGLNRGSDFEVEPSVDGTATGDGTLKSSVVGGGPGGSGPVGRSSGDAFEADDGGGVLAVQVVEPAEALTKPTTTAAPPTTAPPTTAAPSTAQPSTSTSEATTTVVEPTTTTVEPTTTTTEEEVVGDLWVTALSPGSTDGGSAPALQPGDIVLQAEGSGDILAYRFRLYVLDDDKWKRVESSGWRLRREFDTWFRRYDGRTIRWTVEGRTIDGTRTPPTPPLYIRVESEGDSD